ncbi:MAG: ZIP zinc transporter-domain-containing protein [Monoraphidium minutum]|nr:MAG: ZIP zinc transporter-domain-containing protein [Monoraphidium minutum]
MAAAAASGLAAGIALAMCLAAGLCTVAGGALVFVVKGANRSFLSASLGLAAGVMVYVSFVEILGVSALESFKAAGASPPAAARYATFGFFGGALLTWLLGKLADGLMGSGDALARLRRRLARRKVAAAGGGGEESSSECDGSPHGARVEIALSMSDLEAAHPKADASSGPPAGAGHPRRRSLGHGHGHPHTAAAARPTIADPEFWCAACRRGCACGRPEAGGPDGEPLLGDSDGGGGGASDGAPAGAEMDVGEGGAAALSKLGLLAALAIGIHNLPEGVATFIAAVQSPALGALIVVAIALHNIPEGICIAMPIYYSTGSRWRALAFCLAAGMAEPLGGLLGWAALSRAGATPLALAVMFSVVSGMMVFISLAELLPTALRYDPGGRLATAGLYSGMAIMAASLMLFSV